MTTPPPIRRLRLRLTAWYLVTLCVIVALLGIGLFTAIRRQFEAQLATSLHQATLELERAARIREQEAGAGTRVVDAVDELHIPDRSLYLLDTAGTPVKPVAAEEWIRVAARRAVTAGVADAEHERADETTLRLHAERFALGSGEAMIAIAVADKIELEDRYAALIAAFGAAALVAMVLVASGGWLLVRQSTAPIERSMEQMRRFMADAAHELRSPLTVLRTQAEIALQQPRSGPEYVDTLHAIDAESQRLARIVNDLLTLARADAGERSIEQRRIFLDDIALDAAEAVRGVAGNKGVTLTIDQFEEAAIIGDPELIRRLVIILLDNAVKFTPAGGIIRIGVNSASGTATLTVTDTGVGIPADQLPHVFERFYRGDPARGRTDGVPGGPAGAGLGLAIAQWIADAHHARIEIRSEPGRGTAILVRFPSDTAPAGSLSSS